MSNIEKIKAEIERLYDGEAPKHDQQCEFEDGYFTGIATISKFIDSLPEEFPPYCTGFKGDPDPAGTSDLEEAALEYIQGALCDLDDGPTVGLAKAGFIAGAKWQREQDAARRK